MSQIFQVTDCSDAVTETIPFAHEDADAELGDADEDDDEDPVSFVGINGETPRQIVFETREWEKVRKILENSQFFGLFNMSRCHPCCLPKGRAGHRLFDAVFKVLPLLLVLVQVTIPIVLLRVLLKEHPNGSLATLTLPTCHLDGDPNRKILMAVVGLFYVVRMTLLFSRKMVWTAWDPNPNFPDKLIQPNSVIAWWGLLDYMMAVPYEFVLYIFNLWIVYHEQIPLNMILNCLAFEFVMNIDNEYKEMYFAMEGDAYRKKGARWEESSSNCDPSTMYVIYDKLYESTPPSAASAVFDFVRSVVFFASYIIFGAALVASVTATTLGAVCAM